MNAVSLNPQIGLTLNPLQRWLAQAWAFNRLATFSALLHLILIPIALLALAVDGRVITGAPAWLKPLKFAVSVSIYQFTFLWLLTYVKGWPRLVQWLAGLTGIGFLVEIAVVVMQVIRGTTSHFNNATPLDAALFSLMGLFVVIIALMNLILATVLIFQRLEEPVFAWALRLGVLGAFAGMMVAFLMTTPTPEQLAAMEAGERVTQAGAHSVGVEDGGPGLPLVGWSTEGGDLRVPHFVGLHAMQVLPLVGWWLTRRRQRARLSHSRRLALIWIAGLAYIGLTGLLTWQALQGQSVIAPDLLTWSGYALLFGGAGLAALLAWRPRRHANPYP